VPIAAPGLGCCPRHLPATGWTPAAWLLESRYSPIPGVPGPAAGGCRSSRHPAPPVPVTGGLPCGLRGWACI